MILTSKDYIKELIEEVINAASDFGSSDENDVDAVDEAERNLNNVSDQLYKAVDNLVEDTE